MRNRKRLIKKMTIISRSVVALTGFFVLFASNGLDLRIRDVDFKNLLVSSKDNSQETSDGVDSTDGSLEKEKALNTTGKSWDTLEKTYTVRIDELVFTLGSRQEVIELLDAAKNRYDKEDEYEVILVTDPDRLINAMTAKIVRRGSVDAFTLDYTVAGVTSVFDEISRTSGVDAEDSLQAFYAAKEQVKDFEGDPHLDIKMKDLMFADDVEIAEGYGNREKLTPLNEAIDTITQDKQKEVIYEVQPGDTLSQIAISNDISMDELIEINESLTDENSTIRAGEELTITIPEPELSFMRVEQEYYEEGYNAPIEYVDNDDWYTTDQKTLQEPVAGFHRVIANVTYRNDREESREIMQEEIVMDATPKIVERGTKIPPSYIKPISGGRKSSGFGKRTAPKKGASTYHRGIDWATPVGTAVWASCSGTVSRAGWGSGYGNVVYIDHPDGRQTRYGHLSKVLVKPGQHVNQGDKIALSGNTGRSTGPHIHFEILIGGTQVDPLKYLQ